MSLNQTLAQLRASVRKYANVEGTTAKVRHPDADVNDYVNRALSRLRFKLTQANPDQRYLSSTTVTTTSGTTLYALPADFGFLISVDMTIDSRKYWLTAYEMNERPKLTSPDATYNGRPFTYRLRGSNIEYLPEPTGTYTSTLWYVPSTSELSSDASTFDTVNRLDDYIIAWAAKLIATKDKQWDLVNECRSTLAELDEEIGVLGRSLDDNSPPRILDQYIADRWGRHYRRWRR